MMRKTYNLRLRSKSKRKNKIIVKNPDTIKKYIEKQRKKRQRQRLQDLQYQRLQTQRIQREQRIRKRNRSNNANFLKRNQAKKSNNSNSNKIQNVNSGRMQQIIVQENESRIRPVIDLTNESDSVRLISQPPPLQILQTDDLEIKSNQSQQQDSNIKIENNRLNDKSVKKGEKVQNSWLSRRQLILQRYNIGIKEERQVQKQDYKTTLSYIEAIKFLQDPQNKFKVKDQFNNQTSYLRLIECSVCCQTFNTTDHRPMNICSQSKYHMLCSQCLQKQPNMHAFSRCYICRSPIIKQEVQQDQDIMTWLNLNKKLGVQFPFGLGMIPKQLHESLRKISMHEFYKIEINRLHAQKDEISQSMVRYKILNQQLANKISEKVDQLNQIGQKMNKQQQKYDKLKEQMENARFLTLLWEPTQQNDIRNQMCKMRRQLDTHVESVQKGYNRYNHILSELIKHENQVHHGKSQYRDITDDQSFYKIQLKCMRHRPSNHLNRCTKCQSFLQKNKEVLNGIQRLRQTHVQGINNALKSNNYWVIKYLQNFTSKTQDEFNESKLRRSLRINQQEQNLLRQIHKQEFLNLSYEKFKTLIRVDKNQANCFQKQNVIIRDPSGIKQEEDDYYIKGYKHSSQMLIKKQQSMNNSQQNSQNWVLPQITSKRQNLLLKKKQ